MCRILTMTSRCSLHEWFYLFSRILDPGSPFFYSSQQLLRGAGYSSRPVHSIQSQGSCLNTFNKPSFPDTSILIPGVGISIHLSLYLCRVRCASYTPCVHLLVYLWYMLQYIVNCSNPVFKTLHISISYIDLIICKYNCKLQNSGVHVQYLAYFPFPFL